MKNKLREEKTNTNTKKKIIWKIWRIKKNKKMRKNKNEDSVKIPTPSLIKQ